MDKQIIIKRIRDCDNCRFRPETSKICSDYENCYMVSEYICDLRKQLKRKEDLINKIEDTIEPYQTEIEAEAFSLPTAIKSILERKEQECEKLKEEKQGLIKDWEEKKNLGYEIACKNEKLKVENEKLVTKCHQLGQENETLRQFLSKEPLALQALQSAYSDYKKRSEVFYEMLKDYKQALKEIKEIAEEDCKQCFEIDGFSKPDDCGICPYNKILEKISEVIDE